MISRIIKVEGKDYQPKPKGQIMDYSNNNENSNERLKRKEQVVDRAACFSTYSYFYILLVHALGQCFISPLKQESLTAT